MTTATVKPLLDLTAADVMTRELMLVPQDMSVQAAARLLARAQVSGAPVVDGQGRCIGVISTTDFVRWISLGARPARKRHPAAPCVCEWEVLNPEALPDETVRTCMTPDPVTTAPETSIGDLAQAMIDAHIHRVLVVDAACRPIGVVSSTDILAAVAYAGKA
jgi:CBS-domain-containing membrane protein